MDPKAQPSGARIPLLGNFEAFTSTRIQALRALRVQPSSLTPVSPVRAASGVARRSSNSSRTRRMNLGRLAVRGARNAPRTRRGMNGCYFQQHSGDKLGREGGSDVDRCGRLQSTCVEAGLCRALLTRRAWQGEGPHSPSSESGTVSPAKRLSLARGFPEGRRPQGVRRGRRRGRQRKLSAEWLLWASCAWRPGSRPQPPLVWNRLGFDGPEGLKGPGTTASATGLFPTPVPKRKFTDFSGCGQRP